MIFSAFRNTNGFFANKWKSNKSFITKSNTLPNIYNEFIIINIASFFLWRKYLTSVICPQRHLVIFYLRPTQIQNTCIQTRSQEVSGKCKGMEVRAKTI